MGYLLLLNTTKYTKKVQEILGFLLIAIAQIWFLTGAAEQGVLVQESRGQPIADIVSLDRLLHLSL